MINKIDRFSYKKRCGRCKQLDTETCFVCDMHYSKFDPVSKRKEDNG